MKIIHRLLLLVFIVTGLSGIAYAQTFEFDNCGAEGHLGPDSGDCDYDSHEVEILGEGVQEWHVPESADYKIKVWGAQGGGSSGGLGAKISGEYQLKEGDVLQVIVGHGGDQLSFGNSAGGGGGSFVVDGEDSPLIIAGGGGGNPGNSNTNTYGQTSTSGSSGGGGSSGSGGSNAQGGDEATSNNRGGGGGGLSSRGDSTGGSCDAEGGWNWENDMEGGFRSAGSSCSSNDEFWGGFGAGGAAISTGWRGSGGGGGYSGGGGGQRNSNSDNHYGGGGGSFISEQVNNPATSDGEWETTGSEPHDVYEGEVEELDEWNEGNGKVIIKKVDGTGPDFCNFRGPFNECIMNETNQLQEQEYNVSSIFEARDNAVFEAFNGPATLKLENTTRISGLWRGEINIESEQPRLEAGASFRSENGRIKIGNSSRD